jgi:mannose-1-phosphate guanylyltransferase
MKAMILAAGEGTRFRPQTLIQPKPALPLLNVPLGYYSFPFLKEAGVSDLVVNTYHLPEQITDLYQGQNHFPVSFSHERGRILGSGGGLGWARKAFEKEENFFLLNADEVFLPENSAFLSELKNQHLQSQAISTLLVMDHPEVGTKFGGIWVNARGEVIGYGKVRPPNATRGYHFLGVQMLSSKIFDFIQTGEEQNILYQNLTAAQKAGHQVQIFEARGHWYETGSLTDYLKATRELLQHLKAQTEPSKSLRSFLSEFAPQSSLKMVSGSLLWMEASAHINNCLIRDFAVLGAGARVVNSSLEAAVVGKGLQLENANCVGDFLVSPHRALGSTSP